MLRKVNCRLFRKIWKSMLCKLCSASFGKASSLRAVKSLNNVVPNYILGGEFLPEELIGKITHFYGKIGVAVVRLSGSIKKGDRIKIKGKGIEFEQVAESMQIEHKEINEAKASQEIGLKLIQPAKEGCEVYKITE